ncbi:arylsulfatase [Halogeometricum rufum]|uniref:Arylsulfatase n=1 Tax=Halogeometricum rufum TaxID=553469 RepID=A0A1I6J5P8_9EURY|nr:sulfatase [Halogeometricum rufum]SFR74313.1 arylsulfatase [Halogeometricum rufum]
MTDKRDVVLVTVDSFRSDRCGFLGSDAGLTPAMDRLAEDGLVFENAVAPAGATSGSSSTFFTGRYPIDRSTASDRKEVMRQNLKASRTLPQRFKDMGYRTAGFTANPWTSRFFGYDAGFDDFEDFMENDLTSDTIEKGADRGGGLSALTSQVVNWWQGQDMYMSWDAFYDQITDWLDEARRGDEPFFCWIFLVDVHMPYLPPKGYRSQSSAAAYAANAWLFGGAKQNTPLSGMLHDRLLRAYDDTVRFTDEFVDRMARAVDDDTALCVHADHGESFGERDGHYGHGLLYEETVRVPLFVANHPETRVERPFSLAGLPDLLTRLGRGETIDDSVGHPVVTSRNNDGWRVVHGGSWRYTRRPEGESVETADGEPLEEEALYDIGRSVTDHEQSAEAERGRVIDAAAELADSGTI